MDTGASSTCSASMRHMSTVVSPTPLLKRSDISNGNPKLIQDGSCMLQEVPIVSGSYLVGQMLAPSATTLCKFNDGVNGNYPVSSPPRKSRGGLLRRERNCAFCRRERRGENGRVGLYRSTSWHNDGSTSKGLRPSREPRFFLVRQHIAPGLGLSAHYQVAGICRSSGFITQTGTSSCPNS